MLVVRSFDVNKPGTQIEKLRGGVFGGTLVQGQFKINDELEIRPGIELKGKWQPMKTKIVGLQKAGKDLEEAGPGGLLGVLTLLDPSFTKADSLAGSIIGNNLPSILSVINIDIHLFEKLEKERVEPIKQDESLMLNVGTSRTLGIVKSIKKTVELELKIPIAADIGSRVYISRRIADRWRLIGWGVIK
jgi:translation initiation factor 2 subunit 3